MAKEYLARHGIGYTEFLYDDDAARQLLYDRLNLSRSNRTVPQIFYVHNGITEYIGGYEALIEQDLRVRLQMETFDGEF